MNHHSSPAAEAGGAFRRALTAVVRPRTYLRGLYALLWIPLWFLFGLGLFVAAVVGTSLLPVFFLGVPVLVVVAVVAVALATMDRLLVEKLAGVPVTTRDRPRIDDRGAVVGFFGDAGTWLAVVLGLAKWFVATALLTPFVFAVTFPVTFLAAPFLYDDPNTFIGLTDPVETSPSIDLVTDLWTVTLSHTIAVDAWEVTTFGEALAVAGVGAVLALLALLAFSALGWVMAKLDAIALGYVRTFGESRPTAAGGSADRIDGTGDATPEEWTPATEQFPEDDDPPRREE